MSAHQLRPFDLPQRLGSPLVTVARFAIDRLYAKRDRLAAKDPIWAAIQARRIKDDSRNMVFLSDDLSIADWEQQQEIERSLVPDPWWYNFALKLTNRPLRDLVNTLKAVSQRSRRGWSTGEVHDLGHSLAARLADQLDFLAENAHGWPGEHTEWPTFEDWTAALHEKATSLRRFAGTAATEESLTYWYTLASDATADKEETRLAFERHNALEEADIAAAKEAMHWVAEHLDILWD